MVFADTPMEAQAVGRLLQQLRRCCAKNQKGQGKGAGGAGGAGAADTAECPCHCPQHERVYVISGRLAKAEERAQIIALLGSGLAE